MDRRFLANFLFLLVPILPACSDDTVPIEADQSHTKKHHKGEDDPDVPPEMGESGSRLRAQSYQGADGSRQFAGWYDSARGEECAISRAGDGTLRCLPTANATPFTSSMVHYFDASCLYPVVPYVCHTSKYIAVVDTSSCPGETTTRFYPVIDQTAPTGTKIFYSVNGECSDGGEEATQVLRMGGAEVPASEFVSAELVTE